jgi:Spy/CpxP family protein refolding chaperone
MIARLNRALSKAGATELTDVQVDQITALIESARESRPGPDGGPHDSALMGSYADAIVSGDPETAKNIAEQIAAEVAVRTSEHLQARAEFQSEVLNVLEQGGQLPVLKEQVGSQGLLRLLSPHRGRFGGGPGGKGFQAGQGMNAPPN